MVLTFEAKGSPVFSSTGKASISALKAIVGPGKSPSRIPTTPVYAILVSTFIPRERKWSSTFFAVLNSLFPSSGY